MASEHRVVLVTAPPDKAAGLARGLVEARLAACVNELPGLVSRYVWKGKVETENETLLIVKTRADRFDALVAHLKARHPYETPEIVALPIAEGDGPYLDWIDASLK